MAKKRTVKGFLGKVLVFLLVSALVVIGAILVTFRVQSLRRETRMRNDAAPISGKFVKAGDLEIFLQQEGPANGPPVLLIHGFGAWSESWRETMTALGKAGFRAIAMDMPPFGYSERPRTKAYTRTEQARRILGVMDALQLPKAHLVGHSFGGRATVEAAMLGMSRVLSLTLVDVALDLQSKPTWKTEAVSRVLRVPPITDAVVTTAVTNPMFSKQLFQKFVADPEVVTDARVETYQRPLAVIGTTSKVSEWMQFVLTPESASVSTEPALYKKIRVRTLVIWGEADNVTPLSQGQFIHELIPGSELVIFQNIGHIPQIENVAKFNEVLLGFLTRK